jgi:hypothetical protein
MKFLLKLLVLQLLAVPFLYDLSAQRREDHFLRRRVVNRLDLEEKINFPLVRAASTYDVQDGSFRYRNGIVNALVSGLQQGQYVAYDPQELNTALSAAELMQRIESQDNQQSYDPYEAELPGEELDDFPESDWEFDTEDDFLPEEPGLQEAFSDSDKSAPTELGSYEMVIQFVEDWVFDKNTSSLRYDMQFIELVWVDPAGSLPDKSMAIFRWKDVAPLLDQTRWPNRFNEAEHRSVKEVFDLRLFHKFLIDVSGHGMASLEEAEKWRKRMVEQAHHLYSY